MLTVETTLLCLAVAVIAGLFMSRLTKRLHLPAVTGYLVAGILVGPFCLGALQLSGLGFNSLHQVEGFTLITQAALGFIAFAIGNEFRMSQLKTLGKKAITIGILQAVGTTVLVDIVLIGLSLAFPHMLSIPSAITLGAIASATEKIRPFTGQQYLPQNRIPRGGPQRFGKTDQDDSQQSRIFGKIPEKGRAGGKKMSDTGYGTGKFDHILRAETVDDPGCRDKQTQTGDPGQTGGKHGQGTAGVKHGKIQNDNGGIVQQ